MNSILSTNAWLSIRMMALITLLTICCIQRLKITELSKISLASQEQKAVMERTKRINSPRKSGTTTEPTPTITRTAVAGAPEKDIPFENALDTWVGKVRSLSNFADKYPHLRIRQMAYLTEDDWLDATRGSLVTEADFHIALGSLRFFARKKTAADIGNAIKALQDKGQVLTKPRDLLPYLPTGFDPTILDQMQMNIATEGNGARPLVPSKYVLTDRPVNRWDPFFMFDASGSWAARSNTPSEYHAILNAVRSYTKLHGTPPTDFDQVKQYSDGARFNEAIEREVFGALVTRPEL